MPPKRKATAKSKKQKQAKQDGQQAVTKAINVPVDELFNKEPSAKVHIDSDGVIYDANLNQTDVGYNSNKFYRLQILEANDRFWCHQRWGRLGEAGQSETKGPDSFDSIFKKFDGKFKAKSGLRWAQRKDEPRAGKYTFLERDYDDDEGDNDEDGDRLDEKTVKKEETGEESQPEPESKLEPDLKSLVELIFDEDTFNKELQRMGYNSEKLPLGKLSKNTLLKGFEYLKELEEIIEDPDLAQTNRSMTQKAAIEFLSNRYYSTIPHIPARKRQPLPKIDNLEFLKREIEMLENLSDMGITNEIMQDTRQSKKKIKEEEEEPIAIVDKHFAQLKLNEATPLDAESNEYQLLEKYLVNTTGHTHGLKYKVHSMFRVDRQGEEDRFQQSYGSQENSCRRLLWHGSRTTNYGGILSQGLRIAPPEAPVSGYMFGKGIYLADISTKSANYCFSGTKDHSLIMVCEAELGDPALELKSAAYDAPEQCKTENRLSTKGLGKTVPAGWKDASEIHENLKGILMPDLDKDTLIDGGPDDAWLQYNEYIVYDVAQVRIRYLIRFESYYG